MFKKTFLFAAILLVSTSGISFFAYDSSAVTRDFHSGYYYDSKSWNNGSNTAATATIYNDDGNNTESSSKVCLIHEVAGPDDWYGCREEYLNDNKDYNSYYKSASYLQNDGLHATAKVWNIKDNRNYVRATVE